MNPELAKEILLRHHGGNGVSELDPEAREALKVAESDPSLRTWLEDHLRFQRTARDHFRAIPAPAGLKDRILAARKTVPLLVPSETERVGRPRWPVWLQAAAILVGLLVVTGVIWQSMRQDPEAFTNFQTRMLSTALRQYRMDVRSSDLEAVRQHMKQGGAPADFVYRPGFKHLSLAGGGRLKWRGIPVSMVCFERRDKEMLYLFIIPKGSVKNPPGSEPVVESVREMNTASWTEGSYVYVLAGKPEANFERYLEQGTPRPY